MQGPRDLLALEPRQTGLIQTPIFYLVLKRLETENFNPCIQPVPIFNSSLGPDTVPVKISISGPC